jgi:hypothetical protein
VIVTVYVVPGAEDFNEFDCVEEAGVDSPPHAARANERTTTNGKTLQRNFEWPRVTDACCTIKINSFYSWRETNLLPTSLYQVIAHPS